MKEIETNDNFVPSKPQRKAKARFWSEIQNNPLIDPTCLSLAEIGRLAGTTTVAKWAAEEPGFRAWFTSKDEIKVMLKMGAEAAVERLVAIVQETDVGPKGTVSAGTQVQAAKLLLEFGGFAPAQQKEIKVTSNQLPEDEGELRKYIADNVEKLKLAGK